MLLKLICRCGRRVGLQWWKVLLTLTCRCVRRVMEAHRYQAAVFTDVGRNAAAGHVE